jgi:hypothetical protein
MITSLLMIAAFLDGEKLHPVVRSIELATGRRPHKSTTHRWMDSVSPRRPPLPYVMLGGQRMCSVEAVLRWIAASTTAAKTSGPEPVARSSIKIERAEQDLADSGW